MRARRATALEGLDDDHAPPAMRARLCEGLRFIGIDGGCIAGGVLWNGCVEQCARVLEAFGALAAGEQTVVTDAVESGWQHVDEEAADELAGCEGHDLVSIAAFAAVILPLEADAIVVERAQAAAGEGDAVGVAREIGQHRLGAAERAL